MSTCTYCILPFRCVKYGQKHDNQSCTNTPDATPTCGSCNGNHIANYYRCPVNLKVKILPVIQGIFTVKVNNSNPSQHKFHYPSVASDSKQNAPSYSQVLHSQSNDLIQSSTKITKQLFDKMCVNSEMIIN